MVLLVHSYNASLCVATCMVLLLRNLSCILEFSILSFFDFVLYCCLFSLQIPFLEYFELRYLIGLFSFVMAVIVTYRNSVIVFTGGIGKNGSTCAVSCFNKLPT